MPFGIVGRVNTRKHSLDGNADRLTGNDNFEVDMGRPIVTNGGIFGCVKCVKRSRNCEGDSSVTK